MRGSFGTRQLAAALQIATHATFMRDKRTMINAEIRVLTKRDAEIYWNLRLEALEREPQSFIDTAAEHRGATSRQPGATRLRQELNPGFVMGAFLGGELVGMAGFFRERHLKTRHKGRIWGVYVRANCRGQGLGRGLLLALLKKVKRLPGLEQVNLSVSSGQGAAKALYRSLGFERFGLEPKALKIGRQYFDEEHMALRLERLANSARQRRPRRVAGTERIATT